MSELTLLERRMHTFYNEDASSLIQITMVRFKGNIGYVREKRRGRPGESFVMSSNTRLGHKADGNRIGREVLELAIHKRFATEAAAAVREHDTLDREVLRSPRWSLGFAKHSWSYANPMSRKWAGDTLWPDPGIYDGRPLASDVDDDVADVLPVKERFGS